MPRDLALNENHLDLQPLAIFTSGEDRHRAYPLVMFQDHARVDVEGEGGHRGRAGLIGGRAEAELAGTIVAPAGHATVDLQRAAVAPSGGDVYSPKERGEECGQVADQFPDGHGREGGGGDGGVPQLPDAVVAPAARAAIGHQRAGVAKSAGNGHDVEEVHEVGYGSRHRGTDAELA